MRSVVEFASPSDARKAIETLHESTLDGRRVIVREDQVRGSKHSIPPPPTYEASVKCKIHVSNLAWTTTWEDLKVRAPPLLHLFVDASLQAFCEKVGPVSYSKVFLTSDLRSRGSGCVPA